MKRLFYFPFLFFVVLLSLTFSCVALEENDGFSNESIKEDLFSSIDYDTLMALEQMGIDRDSFDNIFDVSVSGIIKFFNTTLKDKVKLCISKISSLFGITVVIAAVSMLFVDALSSNAFSLISVVTVCLFSVSAVQSSVSAVLSVIKLSGNFMLSYAPIYTLVVSLAGNPAGALTYNSVALFIAEGISYFVSNIFVDAIGIFFCFSISFMLNESININRFISAVNKGVSITLGLAASVFTGFLSIRSVLGASVDAVTVKSIRFLISSLIPIVGSSISEAYSSLLGSINLIKGSVAVVGILVVLIINLPVIAETMVYYTAFSFFSFTCEGFGAVRCADAFKCFSCGLKTILLLCVFEMFLLIISTGLMLSFKGG